MNLHFNLIKNNSDIDNIYEYILHHVLAEELPQLSTYKIIQIYRNCYTKPFAIFCLLIKELIHAWLNL